MIALRTTAIDDNPPGASEFVDIPQPLGVEDGNLVLVGIALPQAGISVTPPDTGWTEITQTDPGQSIGIACFWKIALNEPIRWVFALSSSISATGVALVYSGADNFSPIEAKFIKLTSASLTHAIPALATSLNDEEAVVFLGASTGGTYSGLPSGYQEAATNFQPSASTISAIHKQYPPAGSVAASSATFSSAVSAAAVAIVIGPSYGTLSVDQVRERIIGSLPPGVENVYDLQPGGDYYKYYQAVAATAKVFAFDLIELLQQEVIPYLSRYKLPDWERVFGLTTTQIAKTGTIPQRQTQVLASWRVAAGQGSSIAAVQGVLGPLLGYADSSNVQIIETDRAALTAAHTYIDVVGGTLPASIKLYADDDGVTSQAGPELTVILSTATLENVTVTLTAPDGTTRSWTDLGTGPAITAIVLRNKDFAGSKIWGVWTVDVTMSAGSGTLGTTRLFVEGIGRDVTGRESGLGGVIFEWGVLVDFDLYANNPNFVAARAALQKMNFSHTDAHLILQTFGGGVYHAAAIPDAATCFPDAVIPS